MFYNLGGWYISIIFTHGPNSGKGGILTLCGLETPKWVLWQTVETQMQDAGSTQVGLCSGDIYIHKTQHTDHNSLHSRLKALERHNLTPQSDEDNINKLHMSK